MKPPAILLSLMLLCCKSETKNEINSENGIDESVYVMWNDFTKSNPEFIKEELPESTYFHDNESDANRLAELIVIGKSRPKTC